MTENFQTWFDQQAKLVRFKYHPKESVWYIYCDIATHGIIDNVSVELFNGQIKIQYWIISDKEQKENSDSFYQSRDIVEEDHILDFDPTTSSEYVNKKMELDKISKQYQKTKNELEYIRKKYFKQ